MKTVSRAGDRRYEIILIIICCVSYGVVNFEMFASSYMMPFIQPALKLRNVDIGILASAYWVTFSISSYLTGELADRAGSRKAMLVGTMVLFSVLSIFSGFVSSFWGLLMCRISMGAVEGPLPQLVQSLVALETPSHRRGMNAGIVQTFGPGLFGALLGPILLVQIASRFGWRAGFFVAIVPGLICALLIARAIRAPAMAKPAVAAGHGVSTGLRRILTVRNVWICIAAGCLSVACLTISAGFLPLFFVRFMRLDAQQMGWLMGMTGVSTMILGPTLPTLSDRIGRRPVAIGANLLGAVCVMAIALDPPAVGLMAVLIFFAWAGPAAATLFFITIPSESVSPASISRTIGLVIGLSTLLGGIAGPSLAGVITDRWGLQAPLLLVAGFMATIALLSAGLASHRVDPGTAP